jgi:hypothetical protein
MSILSEMLAEVMAPEEPPPAAEPEQPPAEPVAALEPGPEPVKLIEQPHRSLPAAGDSVDEWRAWHRTLDAETPPSGVPAGAWTAYITAAAKLIGQWGDNAHALGWTFADLFGANRLAP